ncbi:hypothetical protein M5C72_02560 [Companilactobacillus allii]|uniref:Uncharacterized protein n=1 Tax=Companilactobacillus allii TaxID=1847728 RepID=A0A1P8Q2I1_9LACO|nr:hypothetical protein [Companilactobacillus allii]APX72045.1 hypothetical protein BTM29_05485 [Companilactobacillus allii]USQ69137.1 hypothetical protein M5C72_02560 [Companilactobacillus allii]
MFESINTDQFKKECRYERELGEYQRRLSELPLEIKLAIHKGYTSIQKSYIFEISDEDINKLEEMRIHTEKGNNYIDSPYHTYIFRFWELATL